MIGNKDNIVLEDIRRNQMYILDSRLSVARFYCGW